MVVVSRIFRVTGSSEHTHVCNDLQNKQENDSGGSATSSMLKLGSHFYEKNSDHSVSNLIPYFMRRPSFIREEGDPFFVESG